MNEPLAENELKKAMRREAKAALADLDDQLRHDASVRACARLAELDEFAHASVVMLYMPLETEVDVTGVALRCFQEGKTICVPRVDWAKRDMIPVEVTTFDDRMDTDEYGVRAPRYGRPVRTGPATDASHHPCRGVTRQQPGHREPE
jgi:5,10-methenyltetrahydrofolate synthetase